MLNNHDKPLFEDIQRRIVVSSENDNENLYATDSMKCPGRYQTRMGLFCFWMWRSEPTLLAEEGTGGDIQMQKVVTIFERQELI